MSKGTQEKPDDNLRWWEWISLPSLLTALIYVMGWSYAYAYYAAFHQGLLSIEIPGEYFIIYGFWVLRDHAWLALLYLGAVAGWGWLRRCPQIQQTLLTALVPLLLLALFAVAYQLARHSAINRFEEQRAADFPAYPRVRVWLKEDDKQAPELQAVAAELPKGCYRLLLQSNGQALLFYTEKGRPTLQPAILHLPLGEIRALRVLPQYGSCS